MFSLITSWCFVAGSETENLSKTARELELYLEDLLKMSDIHTHPDVKLFFCGDDEVLCFESSKVGADSRVDGFAVERVRVKLGCVGNGLWCKIWESQLLERV